MHNHAASKKPADGSSIADAWATKKGEDDEGDDDSDVAPEVARPLCAYLRADYDLLAGMYELPPFCRDDDSFAKIAEGPPDL